MQPPEHNHTEPAMRPDTCPACNMITYGDQLPPMAWEPSTNPDGLPSIPPRKPFLRRRWVRVTAAGVAAFIVAAIAVGVASGSDKPVAAPTVAPVTATVPAQTSDPNGVPCVALNPNGYCPGDKPFVATPTPTPTPSAPAPTVPTVPALTGGQQQAVDSAQGYLDDGQGFSKQGLLKQLTSSYGEGFSQSDAAFAIRYLHPNWDQQAVESAQGYLNDGQGFSRDGLIQQLTSSYGEGFTYAQAVYAVNKTMG